VHVHRSLVSLATLAVALVVAPAAPAGAQSAPAGGFADARGILVDLEALTAAPLPGPLGGTPIDPNTFAAASQSCPPQGAEAVRDAVADVNAPPAATASTVVAAADARCDAPVAVASAQTEGVAALINAGAPLIRADLLRVQANSDCETAPNAAGSVFTNLVVNGAPVPLGPLGTPQPNTRIEIPGVATVIVNEQHPSADGRGIVVNAVHVIGASPLLRGDLIISHAVSGVVCPNGRAAEVAEGLFAPDIRFDKDAAPFTARPGDTVTYTATVTNTSDEPCDVLRFVDHLHPVFEFVSTTGAFGDRADDPVATRADGGQDVVIRPTDLVIEPQASVQQTVVVRLRADVAPGTYYNNLEIFCAVNGDFASGPLAPVTVEEVAVAVGVPEPPPPPPPPAAPASLPSTGSTPLLALAALLLVGAASLVGRSGSRS
jgi:uncharacterized repeat protein (TIGR01451 family)